MRYLITYSYDGTNFNGYQKQEGYRTIEDCIEKALTFINNGVFTSIVSSGRTDKGVHALCQKGHFDLNVSITEYKLKCALNSNLPEDIRVSNACIVASDFHARYMVKEKEYRYYLNMNEYNPLLRNYEYQYCRMLDISKMREAIKYFVGKHSFESFTPSKDKRQNYVRKITNAYIENNNNHLVFVFRGNGFIKYQIRNMVGYLIKVGEGCRKGSDIPMILTLGDRRNASITAHPEGLCLTEVKY